jgi:hypothetical protein
VSSDPKEQPSTEILQLPAPSGSISIPASDLSENSAISLVNVLQANPILYQGQIRVIPQETIASVKLDKLNYKVGESIVVHWENATKRIHRWDFLAIYPIDHRGRPLSCDAPYPADDVICYSTDESEDELDMHITRDDYLDVMESEFRYAPDVEECPRNHYPCDCFVSVRCAENARPNRYRGRGRLDVPPDDWCLMRWINALQAGTARQHSTKGTILFEDGRIWPLPAGRYRVYLLAAACHESMASSAPFTVE